MTQGLRHRLRRALASERGMALPTAMFATVAALGLGGAAILSSVDVQQSSKRDSGSKSAIAAADAGVNVAMMRLNRGAEELGPEEPCLEGAEPEAGWCPPVAGTVGGAEYTYQASAAGSGCGGGEYDVCVVATGSANGASRRVFVSFLGQTGSGSSGSSEEGSEEEGSGSSEESGGGAEGLIGEDEVVLSGNADVRVNVGTNGNLVSSGNATICGDIRHGIGKDWIKSSNSTQCSGYDISEGNQTLPSVYSFLPSDIETNNSNGRITKCNEGGPPECQQDSYSGNWSSTKPFDPDTRRISLSGNNTLTVGGGDYWVCSLSLSGNSQLIMADNAQVRFFFDTPENCGGTSTQISLSGNNQIIATGYQPGDGAFEMPGFFLLGSPNIATQANLSGNYSTSHEFVIYGPDTYINISGNATFKGVIAGKQINVSGNGRFEHDSGFSLPPEIDPWTLSGGGSEEEKEESAEASGYGTFTPQFYVECTGPAGATPDSSC